VQRSSETIGTIAAALAKAQAQLVNPEKSLPGQSEPMETGRQNDPFGMPRYQMASTSCVERSNHVALTAMELWVLGNAMCWNIAAHIVRTRRNYLPIIGFVWLPSSETMACRIARTRRSTVKRYTINWRSGARVLYSAAADWGD
jgi:hypothetical protein